MRNTYWLAVLLIYVALAPFSVSWSQTTISKQAADIVRLQLTSGFITVSQDARVDLDSSLIIAVKKSGLSRIPIITEGLDATNSSDDLRWMDTRNVILTKRNIARLTGKEHARYMLLLGAYYAFCPGLKTSENAEAIRLLATTLAEVRSLKLDRWSAQCDILLGKCYMKNGDVEKGKEYFNKVINSELFKNDKQLLAKALAYEGNYGTFIPATNELRIKSLERAIALYHEINDQISPINLLQNLGYMNIAASRHNASIIAANQSLRLQRSLNFPYIQYTLDLLAYLFTIRGDYAQLLQIGFEEVKVAESTKDSIGIANFYMRVAGSYDIVGNHVTEANIWYNKALQKFIKNGWDPAVYKILGSDTFVTYGLGGSKKLIDMLNDLVKHFPPTNPVDKVYLYMEYAAGYEDVGRYNLAERYYHMAEHQQQTTPMPPGELKDGLVYERMGGFYLRRHNYAVSKACIQKYIAIGHGKPVDSLIQIEAYLILSKIDSAMGNFNSMQNLYHYTRLREKLYNESRNLQLEELNVRYQTLQKQKDLENYRAKNQLQEQQAATSRKFTIIGIASLLLIIAFILARFISKQKSARQLRQQKDEIDKKNHELEDVIKEKDDLLISKEWLLKEVHHRVKNNLQLVMSLLNSQTNYLKDENAMKAVLESRHRVLAMSLIHQMLYSSDNVSTIEMRKYIKSLVDYLQDSFETKLSIYFELQVESLRLDVSQAVPVGLILNELITNCLKYAFPYSSEDRISISFFKSAYEEITLMVADNGLGLPLDFSLSQTNSFGMTLIQGLTDDLRGKITIETNEGTTITLVFRHFELSKGIRKQQLSAYSPG